MLGDIISLGKLCVGSILQVHFTVVDNAEINLVSIWMLVQEMVPWWSWYYYINPVSWTLYAIIITQLGDDTHVVSVSLFLILLLTVDA